MFVLRRVFAAHAAVAVVIDNMVRVGVVAGGVALVRVVQAEAGQTERALSAALRFL